MKAFQGNSGIPFRRPDHALQRSLYFEDCFPCLMMMFYIPGIWEQRPSVQTVIPVHISVIWYQDSYTSSSEYARTIRKRCLVSRLAPNSESLSVTTSSNTNDGTVRPRRPIQYSAQYWRKVSLYDFWHCVYDASWRRLMGELITFVQTCRIAIS